MLFVSAKRSADHVSSPWRSSPSRSNLMVWPGPARPPAALPREAAIEVLSCWARFRPRRFFVFRQSPLVYGFRRAAATDTTQTLVVGSPFRSHPRCESRTRRNNIHRCSTIGPRHDRHRALLFKVPPAAPFPRLDPRTYIRAPPTPIHPAFHVPPATKGGRVSAGLPARVSTWPSSAAGPGTSRAGGRLPSPRLGTMAGSASILPRSTQTDVEAGCWPTPRSANRPGNLLVGVLGPSNKDGPFFRPPCFLTWSAYGLHGESRAFRGRGDPWWRDAGPGRRRPPVPAGAGLGPPARRLFRRACFTFSSCWPSPAIPPGPGGFHPASFAVVRGGHRRVGAEPGPGWSIGGDQQHESWAFPVPWRVVVNHVAGPRPGEATPNGVHPPVRLTSAAPGPSGAVVTPAARAS